MILVDSSIWSLALRKRSYTNEEMEFVRKLRKILLDLQVIMIGPIRQEILSGISDEKKFVALKQQLSYFVDEPIQTRDYETAAGFFNQCRKNGIQGSHIDFLICAVAVNHERAIFTLDKDFLSYQKYLPLVLL